MSGIEGFRYDDKRVLVVGGATGMGAAAAQTAAALGAEVAVMDIAQLGIPWPRPFRSISETALDWILLWNRLTGPCTLSFAPPASPTDQAS